MYRPLCYINLWIFSFFSSVIFSDLTAQKKPEVDLGGALRFNYILSSWKPEQKKRGGDFGYDMFRINAKALLAGRQFCG